jgi:hypothetical protein
MACTHLILACLFEAITCPAKYRGRVTWLDEDILAALAESIPPLALGAWRWCTTSFFGRNGAFMYAAPNGEVNGRRGYSIEIGAKSEYPLQVLKPFPE